MLSILVLRQKFLYLQMGLSFYLAAHVYDVRDKISVLEPSSVIMEPR